MSLRSVVSAVGAVLMTFAVDASATTGGISGKIIYTASDQTTGSLVTFVNVGGSYGTCVTVQGPTNDRYFRVPDNANGDKMRAILLAAQLAGKTINAAWDDTVKDAANRCYLRSVKIIP